MISLLALSDHSRVQPSSPPEMRNSPSAVGAMQRTVLLCPCRRPKHWPVAASHFAMLQSAEEVTTTCMWCSSSGLEVGMCATTMSVTSEPWALKSSKSRYVVASKMRTVPSHSAAHTRPSPATRRQLTNTL